VKAKGEKSLNVDAFIGAVIHTSACLSFSYSGGSRGAGSRGGFGGKLVFSRIKRNLLSFISVFKCNECYLGLGTMLYIPSVIVKNSMQGV